MTTLRPALPAHAPSAAQLLSYARETAADTALVSSLPLSPDARTWLRLEGPGGSEAWLLGWPPGASTGWHDHGGSHGAFAVAGGTLWERSLTAHPAPAARRVTVPRGTDRQRLLRSGRGRAFGAHHLHEVANLSPTAHAVSVHAYYPPLPLMRRYRRTGPVLILDHVETPEEWT